MPLKITYKYACKRMKRENWIEYNVFKNNFCDFVISKKVYSISHENLFSCEEFILLYIWYTNNL